jgi:hypothetical protein
MVYSIETSVDLAGLPCQYWSSTYARTRTTSASSAAPGTRLLSDQLSDYRADNPCIQAHLHGLSSRSALDLDDSPTVLRDEEVDGPVSVVVSFPCVLRCSQPGISPWRAA